MSNTEKNNIMTDRVSYYFKSQWNILLIITISGLVYNLGLLAGPWFEGRMTGCLVNILGGKSTFTDMLILVIFYVIAIAVVQISRYIKRFYVRRFANNVNKNMKEVLYNSLVHKSRPQSQEEGAGDILTKAILDVDDCAEGMRKFTTEIFDTGVALTAYAGMLFYDWRLGLICMIFPPISYIIAEKMKAVVQKTVQNIRYSQEGLVKQRLKEQKMRLHIVYMAVSRKENRRMKIILQPMKSRQ
ncbi:MAG: ABC transporter transmembrane domain-containing protein [Lachnospira eligens]